MRVPVPFIPRSVVVSFERRELTRFRFSLAGLMAAVAVAALWIGGVVYSDRLHRKAEVHTFAFMDLKNPGGDPRPPDPAESPRNGLTHREQWHFDQARAYQDQARGVETGLTLFLVYAGGTGAAAALSAFFFRGGRGRSPRPGGPELVPAGNVPAPTEATRVGTHV